MKTINKTLGDKSVKEAIDWLQENSELLIVSGEDLRKIKAEAVREAVKATNKGDEYGHFSCSVYELEDYANQLELVK